MMALERREKTVEATARQFETQNAVGLYKLCS
jgi:hypothetical protein